MLAYQKPSSDRSGSGYTGESSSSANVSKEMKFVKAKESVITTPLVESLKVEKKPNVIPQKVLTKPPNLFVTKLKAKGKSLSKSQRDPQTQHFCHHCGVRGHTRPNCHTFQALKNAGSHRPEDKERARGTTSNQIGEKSIPILVM